MVRLRTKSLLGSFPFSVLVGFLVLTFLTGGAARADVLALVVLRPAAVFFCLVGLWRLKWSHIESNRFLFAMAAAIFALVALHLVPLPPAIWRALPGRDIVVEIDKVAQLGAVWRPISMVPSATWNAFFSLFVPMAVLIFAVQLSREELFRLLPVILCLGLFSGFLGILQIVGPPTGPLYFYNITNSGSAVGLFSNRNHQAILLASFFPMLAVYASTMAKSEEQANVRLWLSIAAVVVLVPLLLITGSRAGLILGVIGLISIGLVYNKPAFVVPKKRKTPKFDLRYPLAAFAILCLGALTVVMSRAEAFQRLFAFGQGEDGRVEMWEATAQMAWKYFPVGSGVGSFVEVYQIDEPYALLSPSYANHAHNDWLELYMTTGLPGLILLMIAIVAFAKCSWVAFAKITRERRIGRFGRLGAITIVLLAIGSVGDYPLRSPSLACMFVIAALWLTCVNNADSNNTGIA